MFNSSDLKTFTRRQTDVEWNGPNTDIARVYPSIDHPVPANLPPHRYVMATESGASWAVNNNADGDLSKVLQDMRTNKFPPQLDYQGDL